MKNKLFLILILIFSFTLTMNAQDSTKSETEDLTKIKHGFHFVDKDGDGYNDNAPDHDNDGIPNGLDEDYKRGMRRIQNSDSGVSAENFTNGKGWRASKKGNGRHRFANCPYYQDSSSVKKN